MPKSKSPSKQSRNRDAISRIAEQLKGAAEFEVSIEESLGRALMLRPSVIAAKKLKGNSSSSVINAGIHLAKTRAERKQKSKK